MAAIFIKRVKDVILVMRNLVKGASSDPQSHPLRSCWEILVPEVESNLEGFVCEFYVQSQCSSGEISEKKLLEISTHWMDFSKPYDAYYLVTPS